MVLVLANRPEGKAVQYDSLSRLLREYPEFMDTEEIEQTKLLHFRNLMAVALLIIPANHNRAHLLNLITRLSEGRCVKYVTGSGAMRSTRRRVLIYEREGKIVPTIRPPRKDSKPPRKPPRRKRKRELPPGCTSFLVTNTYNEHSFRLKDVEGESLDIKKGIESEQIVLDIDDLPMFIRLPSKSIPVSSMKVPTYDTMTKKDIEMEEEFHAFIKTVWKSGISSSCFGWVGTFIESGVPADVEKSEHSNRAKTAYTKMLELYYHLHEGEQLLHGLREEKDEYLRDSFKKLKEIFDESTSTLTRTYKDHIKILGLFFALQRCTKRGLNQYFGDISIRPGSDICIDYLQSVEVYFTMLFRLSCHSPDAKSGPVMLIALENSYSRVMEIYFRLRSGLECGLVYLHQSTWEIVRESIYTEFYLMRQQALGLSVRKCGSDSESDPKADRLSLGNNAEVREETNEGPKSDQKEKAETVSIEEAAATSMPPAYSGRGDSSSATSIVPQQLKERGMIFGD